MKFSISLFIAVIFIGIATFGVLSMSHMNTEGHLQPCLVAAIGGLDCISKLGDLGFAAFHINFFKNAFAVSGMSGFTWLILALLISVLLAGSGIFLRPIIYLPNAILRFFDFPPIPQKLALVRWLSFHENSPTYL